MQAAADNVLARIADALEDRKTRAADDSYVASLYRGGAPAILKKIGEESAEVIMAASESEERLVHEVADLWFHCQVLLAHRGVDVRRVLDELERRFGVSGLAEKRQRAARRAEA